MKKGLVFGFLLLWAACAVARPVVNVYAWGGEIPDRLIHDFEEKTGIHVQLSTFDSNETLYSRMKASPGGMYDVIAPSSYYVDRMRKQGMLAPFDRKHLPNVRHLDNRFLNQAYDPENRYSIPLIWGTTGIFYHRSQVSPPPANWSFLWERRWRNRLMMLDDSREVFSAALLSLGYDPNGNNPDHIRKAFEKLLALVPNIRLFASESIQAVMIDEDADAGLAWNGDAFRAQQENPDIGFVYPEEGFVIWADCLAIPANARHVDEAHRFINYLLSPEAAATIARLEGHAITNTTGIALLPAAIRENPMLYPPPEILARGIFQQDTDEKTLDLYNQYWQRLKLAF